MTALLCWLAWCCFAEAVRRWGFAVLCAVSVGLDMWEEMSRGR